MWFYVFIEVKPVLGGRVKDWEVDLIQKLINWWSLFQISNFLPLSNFLQSSKNSESVPILKKIPTTFKEFFKIWGKCRNVGHLYQPQSGFVTVKDTKSFPFWFIWLIYADFKKLIANECPRAEKGRRSSRKSQNWFTFFEGVP